MQGTRDIRFENCGRRFRLRDFREGRAPYSDTFKPPSAASGRIQNWLDVDGTVTGTNVPSLIGSGLADAGKWWAVEDDVWYDSHGPLVFVKKENGASRALGHIKLLWDYSLHATVGNQICSNGRVDGSGLAIPCDTLGYLRHFGPKFLSTSDALPVTAASDFSGLTGGYGWLFSLDKGPPKSLDVTQIEVSPDSPLIIGIQYPPGTGFSISYQSTYCNDNNQFACSEEFSEVASSELVRSSGGNTYHVSSTGFLTLRVVQSPSNFAYRKSTGWELIDFSSPGKSGDPNDFSYKRFSRAGVSLPNGSFESLNRYAGIEIRADCNSSDGIHCSDPVPVATLEVCSAGYTQVAYDKCCISTAPNDCEYA